jgi:hypothetical protein
MFSTVCRRTLSRLRKRACDYLVECFAAPDDRDEQLPTSRYVTRRPVRFNQANAYPIHNVPEGRKRYWL